jgi:hypothetical protein
METRATIPCMASITKRSSNSIFIECKHFRCYSFLALEPQSPNRMVGSFSKPNSWQYSKFILDLFITTSLALSPISLLLAFLYLDLSNNFSGPLPHISSSSIRYLDLSNNSFNGSLSPIVCEQKDKMRYVQILDLSKNLLSGELPDCWMNYSDLRVLILGSNKLTGNIPSSLGSLSALELLSLNRNNLSGDLPMSLQNCKGLVTVDLSENHLSGGLSIWLRNSSASLRALVLRSNRFHGSIPPEFCHFNLLQIMDLSHNKLSGSIPQCFGNLSAMVRQVSGETFSMGEILLIMKGAEYEYYSGHFSCHKHGPLEQQFNWRNP